MKLYLSITLLLIFAGLACKSSNSATVNSQSTPSPVPITKTQPDINVQLTFKIENLAERKPKIVGQTNLPNETKLGIWIKGKSLKYNGQGEMIVMSGKFESSEFSLDYKALPPGKYEANITMPISNTQPPSVRAIIGEKAERLKGDLVKPSNLSDLGNVVEANQEFQIK